MALLFMDGFSHYTDPNHLARKWTTKNNNAVTWAIEPAGGRTAGCVKRTNNANGGQPGYLVKAPTVRQGSIWSPQNSGVCGFALKVDDLNRLEPGMGLPAGYYLTGALLSIWVGTTTQFGIGLNRDGTISTTIVGGVSRSFSIGPSISAINNNSWAFLEFKWLIHPTAGSLIYRANGIEIFNYSGPTQGESYPYSMPPATWTSVKFLDNQSSTPPYVVMRACDFYLLDTTGSVNNDFLGDVSIKYIRPDEAGITTGWTPTPAVPNWQNVNEVPPNDDTSYNSATAPGTVDLYGFEPCGINPLAMQHCILARRTIPGSATIKSIAKPLGVNVESLSQAIRNETYEYNLYPYDINPATGIRWTQAEVDAAQFGVNKDS